MMGNKWFKWCLVNSFFIIGIVVFLVVQRTERPGQAYVVNQSIFNGFKGTKELNKKLDAVKEEHKQILDSLLIQIEKNDDNERMRFFTERSEAFQMKEQQLSERYTQQIWKQINTYLDEYGAQNEYELIFGANGSGALMYASEVSDITDSVLEYINRRYEGEEN